MDESEKLGKLVQQTKSVLYQLSSVFPFQLFPDKIIVDETTVTIVRRHLFFKRVNPLMISDIRSVRVNRSILFAAMEFQLKGYHEMPSSVTHLWPNEATRAKQYILGILKSNEANIDLSKLTLKEVKEKLLELGRTLDEPESLF